MQTMTKDNKKAGLGRLGFTGYDLVDLPSKALF